MTNDSAIGLKLEAAEPSEGAVRPPERERQTVEEFIASEEFPLVVLGALAKGIEEAVAEDRAHGRGPFAAR